MTHYPDQRYAAQLTVIKREVSLPDEALGQVSAREGQRVDMRDVVATGVMPAPIRILDVAGFFDIRRPEKANELVLVSVKDRVDEDTVIAGKSATRGKRLYSPVKGLVSRIEGGRVFIQTFPDVIELDAGVRGRVTAIKPGRGVTVEAVGALVQGVWGNNRRTIATLRPEPKGGLGAIITDEFDLTYRGAVVVTERPINATVLQLVADRGLVGLIAPSMDVSLMPQVTQANSAILLTEGFGQLTMSRPVYNLLNEFDGQQVTLDAYTPSRWEPRFPEVIINLAIRGENRPSRPNAMLTLRPKMTVRITRAPYAGQTGQIVEIPTTPPRLPNGLRVPSARVELVAGETVFVPLANLEVLGR